MPGKSRLGVEWQGKDLETTLGWTRRGTARSGSVGHGMARHGRDFKTNNTPPQHSIRHADGYAPAANDSPVVFLEG